MSKVFFHYCIYQNHQKTPCKTCPQQGRLYPAPWQMFVTILAKRVFSSYIHFLLFKLHALHMLMKFLNKLFHHEGHLEQNANLSKLAVHSLLVYPRLVQTQISNKIQISCLLQKLLELSGNRSFLHATIPGSISLILHMIGLKRQSIISNQ